MSEVVENRVVEALSPVVKTMGVELVEAEWTGGLLKLVVDADDGVSTDTLAKVNRLVYPLIEQQSLLPSAFSLEVTSPGLEKPLTKPIHFQRSQGKQVSVRKKSSPHHLMGKIVSADETAIEVEPTEIDGKATSDADNLTIELDDITKAKLVFDWKAALSASKKKR